MFRIKSAAATSLLVAAVFIAGETAAWAQGSFLGRNSDSWRRQLESPDAKQRRSAAFALGKAGGPMAIRPLIAALQSDADAKVKEAAAMSLGEIGNGDDHVIAALANALQDGDDLVLRSAAVALGLLGAQAREAADALEQAYASNSNPNVRQNVVWALGRIGVDKSQALAQALRDGDPLVKRDAANALARLEPSAARPALNALLNCCQTGNSELRKSALNVLSKVVTPEDKHAVPVLQQVIEDDDTDVRINAALTLGNIGGDRAAAAALPVLTRLLNGEFDNSIQPKKDGPIKLKRQAAAMLRNFGAAAAELAPMLERMLHRSPDADLRANSAVGLGGIGEAAAMAIPTLVTRVADPKENEKVRTEAANALSRMGTPPSALNAVPQLLRVLGDVAVPTKVRERILWALRVHNVALRDLNVYPTFEKVIEEKGRDAKALRYDCAYMLGILKGPAVNNRTLEVLHEWLQDDSIQLYQRTDVTGGANITEGANDTGIANVVEKGGSDGRIMVLQALAEIGRERARQHPPIITQLRNLAAKAIDPDVRKTSQKLLLAFD